MQRLLDRWFAIRMELLGSTLVLLTALLCITFKNVYPGLAGLALVKAMGITQL